MGHFIVLVNLLTLFAGLLLAGVLFRRWQVDRRPWPFWQFVHFSGFTFTMVVAALDAYAVVNLGMGSELMRLWSSAVLVGTSVMLFSFPHLSRAEANRPPSRKFSLFWAAWGLVPLACAVWLPLVQDYGLLLILLGVAFLPFLASIVFGLVGAQGAGKTPWHAWVVFLILVSVGAGEVWWVNSHPPSDGYFFVTLPVAYLYTVWNTWKIRSPAAAHGSDPPGIPGALAGLNLSPREREVAWGILKGLSNKELAYQLGLSENTVRNHISNLYRKLNIQKRLDLVLLVQKYQGG